MSAANTLYMSCDWDNTGITVTPSDSSGNSWTSLGGPTTVSSNLRGQHWYARNATVSASHKEFQDWFDSRLAGNTAARRRIMFIPNAGGKDALQFTKEPPLTSDIDEWLARVVCWAFSISPQALIKQMNRATAETAKEQSEEEGITPLLNWLASLINFLVRKYFGYDDVEFAWGQRQDENRLEQAQINQIYVQSGILSVDEVRASLGMPAREIA